MKRESVRAISVRLVLVLLFSGAALLLRSVPGATPDASVEKKPGTTSALMEVADASAASVERTTDLPEKKETTDKEKIPFRTKIVRTLLLAFVIGAVFEALAVLIALMTRWKKGSRGDEIMLTSLTRVIAIIAVLLVIIGATGKLTVFSSIVGAFAGMLLGWSLQAPVSGIAAWVLVSIKRPFRIGDRVQFPSLGLVGDVIEVGFMYTKLNQVGGSIGSEDAIGRHVLIPNAMLFSQVAINYTPVTLQGSAYLLDEVVIRMTYDSDWDEAERILLASAHKVTDKIIKATGTKPYVRADNYDYGVFMRLRFMTLATDRPRISHQILREIFRQVQTNSLVDFAIPFIYSYRKGMEGASGMRSSTDRSPAEREVVMDQIDDSRAGEVLSSELEERIIKLSERIRKMGLLQSVVVERTPNGRYSLLAGRLRYLACRRLGWKTIPAIVRERGSSSVILPEEM